MKVLTTRDDGIEIIKIESSADISPFLSSFTEAYLEIFSGAPYFELFYTHEAKQVFEQNLQAEEHITLLAVDSTPASTDESSATTQTVVGIGFAVPLRARPDVGRQLRGLIPIDHTFYLAELGIRPAYRRRGLGRELTLQRLRHIDPDRFNHVVLRTSIEQDASQKMYAQLGFSDMGVYSEVTSRKLDGQVKTDHRLFLSRLIQTSS